MCAPISFAFEGASKKSPIRLCYFYTSSSFERTERNRIEFRVSAEEKNESGAKQRKKKRNTHTMKPCYTIRCVCRFRLQTARPTDRRTKRDQSRCFVVFFFRLSANIVSNSIRIKVLVCVCVRLCEFAHRSFQ